ncbi:tyramine beta-hydroxylase-like isoform X1 [Haliotis rufescens]|uniref:tyramine beta-hydroxylase-like isoform X1 n=1 Tax=Haliotis rufescens TaxID=6454 RepID=UPI00201F4DB6|nr:tyramine beta-hydroxylase-like isoform X1 [Haliotis rufescens]
MCNLGVLTLLMLMATATAFRFYQDEIPNGDHVPHPCKPNYLWWGVGHANPLGGGPKNPFGQDFARYHSWTEELCRLDSDGDGMTNGQELGDPNCVWTKGNLPQESTSITHPGVCDPWGSDQCRIANQAVTCETGEFKCDGINGQDVMNITLRFPPTAVPAEETSYMCFTFELDMLEEDSEYHLIGSKPFIDNANVMHHIVITGCDATSSPLSKPELCNMAAAGCQKTLQVWTLGMPGECVYREAGFKFGKLAGITRINMQFHWTNPQKRTDYIDSSGLTLFVTKQLRRYNAAYFTTGQTHLVIPPGMPRVVKKSTCTPECTRLIMSESVHLMTGWNHMHYLGYQQNVELNRNGEKLRDLTPDDVYSYDNPIVYEYNPPVEVRPGDSLETTCVFRSTSRSTTARYGEGSFDEMCFGVFTFYPAEAMVQPSCLTWDDLDLCTFSGTSINDCDLMVFINQSHPERQRLFSKVLDNCNAYGGCRSECPAALAEVRQHPCLRGRMEAYIEDIMPVVGTGLDVVKFFSALESCDCVDKPHTSTWKYPVSGAGGHTAVVSISILLAAFTMMLP